MSMMVSMEKPKKMTLDLLAQMMNRSFEHMDKRFDKVENRLDKVENKLDKVEVRLEGVERTLKNVDFRLEAVEQKVSFNEDNRMNRLEEDMRKVKTKLNL
jgi:archaellum component FlaC